MLGCKQRRVKIPHHLLQNLCVLLSYLIPNFGNKLPKLPLSRLMFFRASAARLFNAALPLHRSLILYSGFIIHIMKLPWQHAGLAAASGVAFHSCFLFLYFFFFFFPFLLSVFWGFFPTCVFRKKIAFTSFILLVVLPICSLLRK